MNKSALESALSYAGLRLGTSTVDAVANRYVQLADSLPTPPMAYCAVGTPKTSAELAALAIEAEAAEQKAAEAKARADQLAYHLGLANATAKLIYNIQALEGTASEVSSTVEFANYRKDLAPLAAEYGYKVVLVGDKTKATLSK